MKPFLLYLLSTLSPFLSGANMPGNENIRHGTLFRQERPEDSAHINRILSMIDKRSEGKEKIFNANKTTGHRIGHERWQHFEDKQFSRIIITYTIDSAGHSIAYTEKYYLRDGALIYAYESEVFFLTNEPIEGGTMWAGDFYFSNGKLIDRVTLGHGRSELDDWDPEREVLQKLESRKVQLKKAK